MSLRSRSARTSSSWQVSAVLCAPTAAPSTRAGPARSSPSTSASASSATRSPGWEPPRRPASPTARASCSIASTSALYIARHLKDREAWHGLTVVTNSIRIASELAGHPGITVLMLGGRVRWGGPLGGRPPGRRRLPPGERAEGLRRRGRVHDRRRAFPTRWRRRPRSSARWSPRRARSIAVVDHTKWGRVALATFCRTDRLTGVFTDGEAPATMVAALRDMGIQVTELGQPGPADVAGQSSEVAS